MWAGSHRILRQAGRQYIVYEPFALRLAHPRSADEPSGNQHLVCWLKDALQVGWVSLRERELGGQRLESYAPREPPIGPSHFKQPVETARNRRC
ncbi:MAG: hypothetical protein NVSMB22_00640 [Chloroflexota bacterium]